MTRNWNQSLARRSIMGREETNNPSLAASSLLGRQVVRRAKAKLKRAGKRRAHKGNPLPAVASILGAGSLLGKLGHRFKSPAAQQAVRKGMVDQAVAAHNQGLASVQVVNPKGKMEQGNPRQLLTHWSTMMATPEGRSYALNALQNLGKATASPVAPTGVQTLAGALAAPGTIRALAQAAKPRAQRRSRYPTYVGRDGRQRYSYKPPGSELRIPAGATPTAGTPYSFFRGAVGKGGAAATAGQVAVAAAAGIGAYLVTQRLLQHLGGRAQRAEEAGVNAALASRQARADFVQQTGRQPTRAELQQMGAAYKRQLVALGYDPVTFTRKRGAVASFLETYNPFGG